VIEDKCIESSTFGIRLAKAPLGVFNIEVPTYQEVVTEEIKENIKIIRVYFCAGTDVNQ
jgi:hypothetical protein